MAPHDLPALGQTVALQWVPPLPNMRERGLLRRGANEAESSSGIFFLALFITVCYLNECVCLCRG